MPLVLRKLLSPYLAPLDDDASTGGGAVDRGDDYVPTEDDESGAESKLDTPDDEDTGRDENGRFKAKAKDADAEEGDDEPEKPKTRMIPKQRFDEARRKDRERIRELE